MTSIIANSVLFWQNRFMSTLYYFHTPISVTVQIDVNLFFHGVRRVIRTEMFEIFGVPCPT